MKTGEKVLTDLEERIGPVEPPTDAEIEQFGHWLFERIVEIGFLRWFREAKPKPYRKFTLDLVKHREDRPGVRVVINKTFHDYADDYEAAGSPMGELDHAYVHSWSAFTHDKPDLANKRPPTHDELMAVIGD